MSYLLLLLALACSGCRVERQHYHPKPEAHDFFGPDICSRRVWPYQTVAAAEGAITGMTTPTLFLGAEVTQ